MAALKRLKPEVSDFEGERLYEEWREMGMESLTSIGTHQMVQLGKWLREDYFDVEHPSFIQAHDCVHWYSSSSERAIESGQAFWKGFGCDEEPQEPLPLSSHPSELPQFYFQAWRFNKEFRMAVQQVIYQPDFKKLARANEALLRRVWKTISESAAEKYDPVEMLFYLPYIDEYSQCEAYWPSGQQVVLSKFAPEEQMEIAELSQWVTERKLFIPGFGSLIGGKLLHHVTETLRGEGTNSAKLSVYSCHDYSIYGVLSALGLPHLPSLPTHVLGFGSSLLFECYETEQKSRRVRVRLLPLPFRDPRFQPEYDVTKPTILDGLIDISFVGILPVIVQTRQNPSSKKDEKMKTIPLDILVKLSERFDLNWMKTSQYKHTVKALKAGHQMDDGMQAGAMPRFTHFMTVPFLAVMVVVLLRVVYSRRKAS